MSKLAFSRLKILVVDTHAPTRMFLREILEAAGVTHVQTVADVKSALPLLKDRLLDLLICDLRLGAINGQALIKAVRQNRQFTNQFMPIIVMTGDNSPQTVRELLNLGINRFIAKPAAPDSILDAIRGVLERPRAFVTSKDYFGPDRRNRQDPALKGRRRTDRDAAAKQGGSDWD